MYRVNGGVWQNSHLAAPGSFDIPGLTNGVQYAVRTSIQRNGRE